MTDRQKLPLVSKVLFGAGDLAGCLSYTIIGFFYLYYLTDVVQLRPLFAGAVVLLGKIWDAITDPVIGSLSDRTSSRWGRRRVYLLAGAAPLALSFFLLWTLSPHLSQLQLFALALVTYILHMTAVTVVMVPYQTLTAEMTTDYDERTSLTAYRMFFSIIGGMVGVIVPKLIVDRYATEAQGFGAMALVFALAIGAAPLLTFAGARENGKPVQSGFAWRSSLQLVWANRPFRLVLAMFLVTWTAINLLEGMFLYFFKYWLDMADMFEIIVGVMFVVATLFLPFWAWCSRKIGKRRAYMAGIGLLAAAIMAIILVVQPGMLVVTLAMTVIIGIGISAAHVIPHAIIPDSVDYGVAQSGQQIQGLYYGCLTFMQKSASAAAIGISGALLDIAGYVPNTPQTPLVLWTIRILLGPVPGLLLLLGILSIRLYPIDRDTLSALHSGAAQEEIYHG